MLEPSILMTWPATLAVSVAASLPWVTLLLEAESFFLSPLQAGSSSAVAKMLSAILLMFILLFLCVDLRSLA